MKKFDLKNVVEKVKITDYKSWLRISGTASPTASAAWATCTATRPDCTSTASGAV